MNERKVYDWEFKINAAKLSYDRDNLSQITRELRFLYSCNIDKD